MGQYQIFQRHSPTRYLFGCVNIVYLACSHFCTSGVIISRSVLSTMSLPPGFTPKAIYLQYFTLNDAAKVQYKCKEYNRCIVQKKNSGWTNLLNHINSQHSEYIELFNHNTQSTLPGLITTVKMVRKKAKTFILGLTGFVARSRPFRL